LTTNIEPTTRKKLMYPFRVEYVFKNCCDIHDLTIPSIIEYCSTMNIEFQIRKFNPIDRFEDRNFIRELPALQIYEYGNYSHTLYMDRSPTVTLRKIFEKFEIKHAERLAKKQIWDEKLNHLKWMFMRDSLKTDSLVSKQVYSAEDVQQSPQ
jgi:hypothetical protein